MNTASISVRLHKVSVAFQGREVVRDVSAEFPETGISVLMGRSGSGKTTLLRTMNRLNEEFPGCTTTGRVELNLGNGLETILPDTPSNSARLSLPDLRRRVGMVFQTPNVFPSSILKNLSIPLEYVAGYPKDALADRVRTALDAVGLWDEVHDRLQTPAARLSGGQQQRLCLARTLALEPSILLLDEPTASLDVRAAKEVECLLTRLAGTYPIIMVSHSLSQACRLGQQILVLCEGKILQHVADTKTVTEADLAALLEEDATARFLQIG